MTRQILVDESDQLATQGILQSALSAVAIVQALAEFDPIQKSDNLEQDDYTCACVFCGAFSYLVPDEGTKFDHYESCLWLRANELVTKGGLNDGTYTDHP